MEHSNYEPPRSDLGDESRTDADPEVLKHIRNGWIAALVSGGLTFAVTAFVVSTGEADSLFSVWNLIDVGLILGLAFGIYRKSRIAATTMLIYFVTSQILVMIETGRVSGGLVTLAFTYFYARAMIATYQYHRQSAQAPSSVHRL